MQPKKHQIEKAEECWPILKERGYVYLAGKPRSGKTYTAILIAEKSDKIKNVLVLTTKAAIGNTPDKGWRKFVENNPLLKHNYHVTNYEQAGTSKTRTTSKTGKKLKNPVIEITLKLNPKDYDLVIIDESHNLGKLGKFNGRYKIIKTLCWNMPHIHLSGTAIVESPNGIYHQMSISKYSPFKHSNFYDFFRVYGKPYYITAAGRDINQYDKADLEKLMPVINSFTVYMTQEDAGIDSSLQAVDKLHYVDLNTKTKKLYNRLQDHQIAKIQWGCLTEYKDGSTCPEEFEEDLVCDTVMKLRTSLHMLESGVVKIDDEYIELGNTEKIDYIKNTFGDNEGVGIMCHFVGEQQLCRKHFKHATIYSSTADAEGVDLSHLTDFIIMSSGYSGAKFIQRRERIINTEGSNTLLVHHILVKKAISEQVYNKVSKKQDFNNSTYERTSI